MYVVSTLIDHQPVSSFGEIVATRLSAGWFCLIHFQKVVVSGGEGKLWNVSGFFGLTRPSAYASGRFKTRPSLTASSLALTTAPPRIETNFTPSLAMRRLTVATPSAITYLWSYATTSSFTFLPPTSSPPWALISSKISSVAFLWGMPQGAAGPDSGVETPNLMTSCARVLEGSTATNPAAASSTAKITKRCDLIAHASSTGRTRRGRPGSRPAGRRALQVGLGQRASRTRTIETSIAPCQWGTAVKGSRPVGGLDYTHAHVDAREGDPVPEVSAGVGRRARRPGRGAPLRSGRGAGTQGPLREPGHPDPASITPGALGLSVQRRLPGRGGRARPGERGRAEPAPALPSRLVTTYATAAIAPTSLPR